MWEQRKDGQADKQLETPAPVVPAPAPAQQPQQITPDTLGALNVLLQILAKKEEREAKLEAERQRRDEARDKQREQNAKNVGDKEKLRQARCDHMKGGKNKLANRKDPALYQHTYINAETVIKCLICRMVWKTKDTTEYLWRNGRKIRNHTKWGWEEAYAWLKSSTNQPSSSEIPQRTSADDVPKDAEIFED